MDMQLQDKVAVVTGASKGIGLAVAAALVGEGAKVVAGSRTSTEALAELGVVAEYVDLASPTGPAQLVTRAVDTFGGVDILVNNVGGLTARLGGFLALTDEDWYGAVNLNLMTAVRASRAALPSLMERQGSIINISSINARLPQPPVIDYAASKAAMTNLGKALAEEFGPQGVRVNTISPGPVRTALGERQRVRSRPGRRDGRWRPRRLPRGLSRHGRHDRGAVHRSRRGRRPSSAPRIRPVRQRHRLRLGHRRRHAQELLAPVSCPPPTSRPTRPHPVKTIRLRLLGTADVVRKRIDDRYAAAGS